jgi:hypothetical protein
MGRLKNSFYGYNSALVDSAIKCCVTVILKLRRSKTLLLHDWMRNANDHILGLAMKFITFMMVIFVSLPGMAKAGDIDLVRMTKFINGYVRNAFGPDRPLLKKLEAASPIAASYECDGIDAASCNAAFENMHIAIRGSNNLKLDFQATPPIIKFVFVKSVDLASRVEAARQEFGNGFADTSDSDWWFSHNPKAQKSKKFFCCFLSTSLNSNSSYVWLVNLNRHWV